MMNSNYSPKNVFQLLHAFEREIDRLEGKILQLEQHIEQLIQVERNHMIRIKNGEQLSDEFIQSGKKYQDLTPEKAWKLLQNKDFDYILLDITSFDSEINRIPGALHIPWEDFSERFIEIQTRTRPILIICEDGTNSILACDFLIKHGHYNCSNISGGYRFWKGNKLSKVIDQSA